MLYSRLNGNNVLTLYPHQIEDERLHHFRVTILPIKQSAKGYLSYLDVSVGTEVSGICTKQGRLDILTVNPQSAIVHLGHPNGKGLCLSYCSKSFVFVCFIFTSLLLDLLGLHSLDKKPPSRVIFNPTTAVVWTICESDIEFCDDTRLFL